MPIMQIFDTSTGHLRSADRKLLEAYTVEGKTSGKALIAYPYHYGWTISTSGWDFSNPGEDFEVHANEARAEGFSEEFVNLMRHAVEQKAVMLRLDADGDPTPGFPTFDWENKDAMSMPDENETTPSPSV